MHNWDVVLVLGIVTVGTYAFKISGLLLSDRLVKSGKVRLFLDSLPATLLISLVVPAVIEEGVKGLLAAILIVWCMYATKNALVAMTVGIVCIAVSRHLIG